MLLNFTVIEKIPWAKNFGRLKSVHWLHLDSILPPFALTLGYTLKHLL